MARMRLTNINQVKRLLASTVLDLREGTIAIDRGKAVIYGCNVLAQTMKTADLEDKLNKIESSIEEGGEDEFN